MQKGRNQDEYNLDFFPFALVAMITLANRATNLDEFTLPEAQQTAAEVYTRKFINEYFQLRF